MEILSLMDKLFIDSVCPKCTKTMLVGVTAKVCGHLACQLCFQQNHKCPICNAIVREDEVIKDEYTERILDGFCSLPIADFMMNSPHIQYFFTPEKSKEKLNHQGETILHKQSRAGNIDEVKSLISSGADINAQDFANWTPLHEAVIMNRLDVVELLLDNGALVNVPGQKYKTALHIAVEQNNVHMVQLLIKYGASLSSCDLNGKTAIDLCKEGDTELIDALCKSHRNVNLCVVFTIPNLIVESIDVEDKDLKRLSLLYPGVLFDADSYSHRSANYVIIGNSASNILRIQFALLRGAFIFYVEGFLKFAENPLQDPVKYLANLPKYAVADAVMNRLHQRPLLFNSVHFYFNNTTIQQIEGFSYTFADFKQLALAGGGTILSRKPSLDDSPPEHLFPFHTEKTSDLSCTTYYIIYDDRMNRGCTSGTQTVKFKTFSWFINCINCFRIK